LSGVVFVSSPSRCRASFPCLVSVLLLLFFDFRLYVPFCEFACPSDSPCLRVDFSVADSTVFLTTRCLCALLSSIDCSFAPRCCSFFMSLRILLLSLLLCCSDSILIWSVHLSIPLFLLFFLSLSSGFSVSSLRYLRCLCLLAISFECLLLLFALFAPCRPLSL